MRQVRHGADRAANRIQRAPGDLDRIEACLAGAAFAPHRHDTYAVGVTLKGVQSFDYRGITHHSLPGEIVVLYPDELHDGRAGDDDAFCYRAAHIAPSLMQDILGGQSLPFVECGVSRDQRLRRAVWLLLADYRRPLEPLEVDEALLGIATALQRVAGAHKPTKVANRDAVLRAREYIDARPAHPI